MKGMDIWVLETIDEYGCWIKIFAGRNKYTKKGIFSGPLRKVDLREFNESQALTYIKKLPSAVQTDKITFCLTLQAFSKLCDYLASINMESFYCRQPDKKLHHIDTLVKTSEIGTTPFIYESKLHSLLYCAEDKNSYTGIDDMVDTHPQARIYFSEEGKQINGIINFAYENKVVRNYAYEEDVKQFFLDIGGYVTKNTVRFHRNHFSEIVEKLKKANISIYWGIERKPILSYKISASISYDMDWFNIQGQLSSNDGKYKLSDILRMSRGRKYIEIGNGVFFLPETITSIATASTISDTTVKIPKYALHKLNSFASEAGIMPKQYLQQLQESIPSDVKIRDIFIGKLYEYQKYGVNWIFHLYKNGFGALLADDMGVGKTIQSIAFLCAENRDWKKPVLIITPMIVMYNWANEFAQFAPQQSLVLAYGKQVDKKAFVGDTVYLTTYETILNNLDYFTAPFFDCIIIDEVQYAKNFRTKRYSALKQLKTKFYLALSGTPIENNLAELWSIFDIINPGLLEPAHKFMAKYQKLSEKNSLDKLQQIISPFVLRRVKEAVLDCLPERHDQYVFCKMENKQKKLYEEILQMARKEIAYKPGRYEIKDNAAILQAILYLREVCSDPLLLPPELQKPCSSCKYVLFKEHCRNLLQSGKEKLIVYSLFPKVLQRMERWGRKQGWKTFYLDGSTINRQTIINNFEQSSTGLFLISLKAGGVGVNLVSCQNVIIYEPWWNTAAEEQAAARIYRVGQQKNVFVYHFLIRDSIEEKIRELQIKKEKIADDVMTEMDMPLNARIKDLINLLN